MKNKAWYERFHDELFNEYNSSGEAVAVHIVRDIVDNIDTRGKWIDVVSMDTYGAYNRDHIKFNWIIIELFPRITHPKYKPYVEIYPTDDKEIKRKKKEQNRMIREDNRYITWHASREDIEVHRNKNHHGEKFIVLCHLYNKNRGKTRKYVQTIVRKATDPMAIWCGGEPVPDGYIPEQVTKTEPLAPSYEYRITAISKITQEQINYITQNEMELVDKICRNGKPTLDILLAASKRHQAKKK